METGAVATAMASVTGYMARQHQRVEVEHDSCAPQLKGLLRGLATFEVAAPATSWRGRPITIPSLLHPSS